MTLAPIIVSSVVFGAIMGSVCNGLIYRLPRSIPVFWARSICPKCKNQLHPISLIPIISYLFQRGKCKFCKKAIPARYLIVELLSIAIYLYVFLLYKGTLPPLLISIFLFALLIIVFTDIETYTIPNQLSIGLTIIGFVYGILSDNLGDTALGWTIGFGAYLLIGVIAQFIYRKPAMGGGDIKLGGAIGSILGAKLISITIYLSFILGGSIGIALIALKIKNRGDYIPFGPAIVLGSIIAIHFGDAIWKYYFG